MAKVIITSADPAAEMSAFLKKAPAMMALLHRNNVLHGDLKLCNFYRGSNGEPGIWDLDSVRIYRKRVPMVEIEKELTRLVASCVSVFHCIPGGVEPAIDALTEQVCQEYAMHSPVVPSWKNVAERVRTLLEYWRKKR